MGQKSWAARIILPALLVLAVTGCGPAPWTGIEGYVTIGRGDYALGGAVINLYAVTETGSYIPDTAQLLRGATTDENGYYRFADLPAGTYMVEVPPIGERPGARFQHLVIDGANKHIRADLMVRQSFLAVPATGVPYIQSIAGADPGALLSDSVNLTITAFPADPALPIKEILVKLGHLSNGSDVVSADGDAVATFTWDTTTMGDGETFLYVITYDLNDNAAIISIPVSIQNESAGTPPPAPEIVRVEAWRFADSYGFKSLSRPAGLPPMRISLEESQVYLPQPTALAAAARAVDGGSAMVHIQIKPAAEAIGYRIYRKIGVNGTYALIGERANDPIERPDFFETAYYVNSDDSFTVLWFNDLDPALVEGRDYYYRVAAVNAAGETDSGHEFHVAIPPRFTAELTSPAYKEELSLSSDATPRFSWSASGGTPYRGYLIYVLNKNDEAADGDTMPFSWYHFTRDEGAEYAAIDQEMDVEILEAPPPRPLVVNSIYEWDLVLAYAGGQYRGMVFDDGESWASFWSFPSVTMGSQNGAFIFTTTP